MRSSFWGTAIKLAGVIDFSQVLEMVGPPTVDGWSSAQLRQAGVCQKHVGALMQGCLFEDQAPWVMIGHQGYPSQLAHCPNAPPVLYTRGNIGLLESPGVAMVGSRAATTTGVQMARRIAGRCLDAGLVIISGLARGIDSAAHEVDPSRTIAVLGQGLGRPLSGRRGQLAERIVAEGGLLLSEFPPHWNANKATFPRRNRVIAGLAGAIVVVEASSRSGALITARWGLSAGREVLAVPGSPLVSNYDGCLQLIEDGAGIVRTGDEVVALFGRQVATDGDVNPLLDILGDGADLDTLAARSGLSRSAAEAALAALVHQRKVVALPGEFFARVG